MTASLDNPSLWMSLLILTLLEIVLGIDNIIFLSIAASHLPKSSQKAARKIGMMLALLGRIIFLTGAVWILKMGQTVASWGGFDLSWKDLVFMSGGLFLIYKSTDEIHTLMGEPDEAGGGRPRPGKRAGFASVIVQIGLLDVVFALDSMITAVGLSQVLWVMIAANVVAIVIMLGAAEAVGAFIEEHPSLKMLALCFLMMVGVVLLADGFHFHIPREYVYAAISFSLAVEALNTLQRVRGKKKKRRS
jgi:predicted tellurium resistance membrane protein TerC